MKYYSSYGHNDFIICCGHLGHVIKDFFANYQLQKTDLTIDYKSGTISTHSDRTEPWKVTLVDTGDETMTGGRLLKIREYIEQEKYFFMTYGDGLTDANLKKEEEFHEKHASLATVLSVPTPGRFGLMQCKDGHVVSFNEKPKSFSSRINGGYFVLSPEVLDYIAADSMPFEQEPLQNLAKANQLMAFEHDGFWQPMDTLREKNYLDDLWQTASAPWKIWND